MFELVKQLMESEQYIQLTDEQAKFLCESLGAPLLQPDDYQVVMKTKIQKGSEVIEIDIVMEESTRTVTYFDGWDNVTEEQHVGYQIMLCPAGKFDEFSDDDLDDYLSE